MVKKMSKKELKRKHHPHYDTNPKPPLHLFKNDKRIKRGNRLFIEDFICKIETNKLQAIFAPNNELKLKGALMDLAIELLNPPNILESRKSKKHANYWHMDEQESLIQAQNLIENIVEFTAHKFTPFAKAVKDSISLTQEHETTETTIAVEPTYAGNDDYIYDAYIDLIRTLMLQDQEGPPGSENLMQDLFNQFEGPVVMRQGGCEVRISAAQFFPLPANNRNYVNTNRPVYTKRRRPQ
jgi:hypothetical protein